MARRRSSSCRQLSVEHDLFGKPVSTFPDHALLLRGATAPLLRPLPLSLLQSAALLTGGTGGRRRAGISALLAGLVLGVLLAFGALAPRREVWRRRVQLAADHDARAVGEIGE